MKANLSSYGILDISSLKPELWSDGEVLDIPPLKESASDDLVLDIALPAATYTSPLVIAGVSLDGALPTPDASPSFSLKLVRNVALAAVALVCVLATTAHASATATSHRDVRQTKYEYARTALLPLARIRK